MNNGMKTKVTLFLVLFLLVVALIVYILTSGGEREVYNPNPVVMTAPPASAAPAPTPTPAPATPAPTPIPTFSPTPYRTAEPVPAFSPTPYLPAPDIFLPDTPVPVVTEAPFAVFTVPSAPTVASTSGTFTSDSGARLNIHADWSAVLSESTAQVTVIVYADHYSIQHHSYQSLFIQLGDETRALYASEIISASNEPQHTELGRTTFTIPYVRGEMRAWPLHVQWKFNGTYGKDASGNPIELPVIECGGILTLP